MKRTYCFWFTFQDDIYLFLIYKKISELLVLWFQSTQASDNPKGKDSPGTPQDAYMEMGEEGDKAKDKYAFFGEDWLQNRTGKELFQETDS